MPDFVFHLFVQAFLIRQIERGELLPLPKVLNVTLEVGDVQDSVTVTAGADMLNEECAN